MAIYRAHSLSLPRKMDYVPRSIRSINFITCLLTQRVPLESLFLPTTVIVVIDYNYHRLTQFESTLLTVFREIFSPRASELHRMNFLANLIVQIS